jgi:hypothetical protein
MCLTVENFKSFVTNELNYKFIKALQYIVFDEAHLDQVSESFWWTELLPQSAQLIILSATLGDIDAVQKIVSDAVKIDASRDRTVSVITHTVRPIPLQYALFKGCDNPVDGVISNNLVKAQRIGCAINRFDPTPRDIMSIAGKSVKIPEDRESQYQMARELIARIPVETLDKKLDETIAEANVDCSPQNIYRLLSYLFSNELQPALVFLTSSSGTKDMVNGLIGVIQELEQADPEFKRATKLLSKLEKFEKQNRDVANEALFDGEKKTGKRPKARSSSQKMTMEKSAGKPASDDTDAVNMADLEQQLKKWKFPNHVTGMQKNCPQWIQDALEYGIGVYTNDMPTWLRYCIFDMFKEGKIYLLVSDTSISVGINLPVRTCVLCGDMTPVLFRQTGGRAGRRGFDTKGYIVPMFNKDKIREYIKQDTPPVSLNLPNTMSFTNLVRLTTPHCLDSYVQSEAVEPDSRPKALAVPSPLKSAILHSYLETLEPEALETTKRKLDIIRNEKWNYHRLTNMLGALPNDESMVFIKLLISGTLHSLTPLEFIRVMSVLFERRPGNVDVELPGDLKKRIAVYAAQYDMDLSSPIDNYLYLFYRDGQYSIDYLDSINKLGNWLYILRSQTNMIAPNTDNFCILINKVDEHFMASCKKALI